MCIFPIRFFFFFFNDTATTEIYTLPLHDALPISRFPLMTYLIIGFCQCLAMIPGVSRSGATIVAAMLLGADRRSAAEFSRSEEHTSELQSRSDLVCRLLLEKKKQC